MKRALCIWLPNWPLQRLAAARAELNGHPVVLYELHSSGGAKVMAYCPHLATAATALWEQALKAGGATAGSSSSADSNAGRHAPASVNMPEHSPTAGIRIGMPLAEATALAARQTADEAISAGPGAALHLERIDPLADRVALDELAVWCHRFSPTVGVEEALAPESLLLDVTGLETLFGGPRALARRIVRAFRRRGLTVRVALADTPTAAWAAAHFAKLPIKLPIHNSHTSPTRQRGSNTPGATGATRDSTGDARAALLRALRVPVIIAPGQTRAALAPLPPAALRLPDDTCALLADLGLRRIDQLTALRRETLLSRFGPLLTTRLDQATGAAAEAIAARGQPPEWLFEQLFEHPTGRREMIDGAVEQLVAGACESLARRRQGMLRLECGFDFEARSAERFVVGFYRPTASPRHVCEVLQLKLERRRFDDPLVAVRLRVLAVDRLEFRQREFFAEQSEQHAPRELAVLVDRLSNRLGPQAVVRPWLLNGVQPEFACQYQPLASLRRAPGNAASGPFQTGRLPRSKQKTARQPKPGVTAPSVRPPGDRPLHLEPEPRPLEVLSVAPEGPPARFRLAGEDLRITRTWGPERIETGWWRGACVRRDYYQVETRHGQRYWLFRELNTGCWFLHGVFT